ncbi:SAV1978 family virulence-associated passenger protein, partial [Staphylococcus aureus]|uniref:SAV1978 family virulence-associated passenger protein n=1 Tax=Staphylococcus aureus TaxID=1280 RepID=UPI0031B63A22
MSNLVCRLQLEKKNKRYLSKDNERVEHIHVVNGTYYFHGHIGPGWQIVKKTFDTA